MALKQLWCSLELVGWFDSNAASEMCIELSFPLHMALSRRLKMVENLQWNGSTFCFPKQLNICKLNCIRFAKIEDVNQWCSIWLHCFHYLHTFKFDEKTQTFTTKAEKLEIKELNVKIPNDLRTIFLNIWNKVWMISQNTSERTKDLIQISTKHSNTKQ